MIWGRLWLINKRAMKCVTRDGHVILSEVLPLAEALYAELPGTWIVTIERKWDETTDTST